MRAVRWLAGFLASCGIAVFLLAACRGGGAAPLVDPSPIPTPDPVLLRDAQEYARMFGISQERALEEMRYQDRIGDLNAALVANEADTFAGLWIQHEPDYGVIVLFTRDGKRTLRPYLKDEPFAYLVQVRAARYSLAELESIQAQAVGELAKLDFGTHTLLSVEDNRVEVPVSDRAWFEGELRRVGAQLPEGVELVEVEGGVTAKDKDLLLTPPLPGVAFPRQKPVEGIRVSMLALMIGTLRRERECLYVHTLDGQDMQPIWPPEFTLHAEGEQLLVLDGQGQVVARSGEEVVMGGGYVGVEDEWVLQQIPDACRREYFVVGNEVRPNLRTDSTLFALDVISFASRTVLFLRYTPALSEQVTDAMSLSGKLVAYDYRRCLLLQTEWGPGEVLLLWPPDWSARGEGEAIAIVDGTGQTVGRMGDEVTLRGRRVPDDIETSPRQQLVEELPGDCLGTYLLVDGIE